MPVFDAATSHLLFVLNHCHWLKGLQNKAQSLTLVKHLNRECVASHSRFPDLITLLVNVHSSKETFACFDRCRSPLLSACWRKAENRERELHLKRAKRREKRLKKWVLLRSTNPVSIFCKIHRYYISWHYAVQLLVAGEGCEVVRERSAQISVAWSWIAKATPYVGFRFPIWIFWG